MATSRIAAQLYTLREYTKTTEDFANTIKRVKEIGYDVVQISGIGPIPYTDIKHILDDYGVICCATHISFERMKDEPETVIEEHNLIGCKYPAIGSMPDSYRNAEGYPAFAKEVNAVGKRLAEGGLRLGYHNHSFELEKFGARTGLQIIFDETNPEYLTAEVDTYWIQHGGGDPAKWIEDFTSRIPLVHLKDMTVRTGTPIMAEVGEGNLNWPRILQACEKAGVEWYIVEQDVCERDPFESLAISLKNLKGMGLR